MMTLKVVTRGEQGAASQVVARQARQAKADSKEAIL